MTMIKTNLLNTRESARQIRFEPTIGIGGSITQTNVQKAIEQLDGEIGPITVPSVQAVTAGGTTTVSSGTTALIFRKSVQSDSPFNLPAGVNGHTIEISDETGLAGDMTATPNGADKIMGVNGPMIVASSGGIAQSGGHAIMKYYTVISGWAVFQ